MPDVGAEPRPLREGRYRLVRRLGEGGMAVVWLAHDERLGVSRAVKVLNTNLSANASLRRRFEAEARTMARLHHRNIVTVHDVDVDGDVTFIIMELVDGGSVWDRVLNAGPLPPRVVCEVIADLLGALEVAHAEGVVHRDVKPHNALIARDGTIKLSDFGIAQVQGSGSATRTGSVMGTLAYMAPEQRSDAKHVGPTADLYAVGGTIYAIATGRDPFDLHSDQARAEQLDALPEPLRAIVDRACRYKPEERWASAAEMRAAVLAAIPDLSETPPETPPLVSPRPQVAPATGAGVTVDVSRLDADPQHSTLGEVSAPAGAPTREGTVPSVPAMAPIRLTRWIFGIAGTAGAALVATLLVLAVVGNGAAAPAADPIPPLAPASERPPPPPIVEPDVVVAPEPPAEPVPTAGKPYRAPAVAAAVDVAAAPAEQPADEPAPPEVPATIDPPPPEAPAAPTVRLYVNAKPRAMVTIDGTERGVTPLTLQVAPGAHVVGLQTDGKAAVKRTLDAAAPAGAALCWDFNAGAVCTR